MGTDEMQSQYLLKRPSKVGSFEEGEDEEDMLSIDKELNEFQGRIGE